ncbi:two-component regulator propeller domain-containing protein [Aureivirga sp. CE67]|uniref:sensor histidine kinase n=1 Tax=Aureivirga sp. CE67 TaxID=1788983 RepID=UPI0018C9D785|nr:two-component regulator propeller domain-containing protein [Aureivirga sp. CE67]
MKKGFFIFLVFLFCNSLLYSQLGFKNYSINEGLSSNTVYDIVQDEKGFILLATDYGISIFDGKKFENFTKEDGLPDNEILYFFKDSYDRIWLVGFNGELGYYYNGCFYDRSNCGVLSQLSFREYVSDIYEDSEGNIWILEIEDGIYKISREGIVEKIIDNEFLYKKVAKKAYFYEDLDSNINVVYPRRDSLVSVPIKNKNEVRFLECSLDHLKKYDLENLMRKKACLLVNFDPRIKKLYHAIHDDIEERVLGFQLFKVTESEKYFWITDVKNGLVIIDKKTSAKINFLESDQTTKSFIDNEGNVWIGTVSNGVFLVTNPESPLVHYDKFTKHNLNSISAFHKYLALGDIEGKLQILDTTDFKVVKEYNLHYKSVKNKIQRIKKYKDHVYFISEYCVLKSDTLFEKQKIEKVLDINTDIPDLSNIKDATFLDSIFYTSNTYGVGVVDFNSGEKKVFRKGRSTAIFAENQDSIWIGGNSSLDLYDRNNELHNFRNIKSITAISKYADSPLIIGTNSSGLLLKFDDKIVKIDQSRGLISNAVRSIFIDTSKNIWIATNKGINKIEFDTDYNVKNIESYTVSEGLVSNNVRSCCVNNNKLYVATAEGFSVINLLEKKKKRPEPKIYINKIYINNREIDLDFDEELDFDQNDIEFDFSGLSYHSLGKITYRYRLLGLENEWIETTSNKIRYSALPPGEYIFGVYAISKYGQESEQVAIKEFIIKPPFYKSLPFLLTVIFIVVLFGVYFIYQKRKKIRIKNKLNSLKFQALNAQMNPHFINNLLSCVQGLIEEGNKKEAVNYLQKFSDLTNLILQSTKQNLISLEEELQIVSLYLDLKKIRYNNSFTYKIDIQDVIKKDLLHIKVPPLILQPLIENSIIHGMNSNPNNGVIEINFESLKDNFILCRIKDNGIGLTLFNFKNGISLKNINERLKIMNNCPKNENLIEIQNILDQQQNIIGTEVLLRIPYIDI